MTGSLKLLLILAAMCAGFALGPPSAAGQSACLPGVPLPECPETPPPPSPGPTPPGGEPGPPAPPPPEPPPEDPPCAISKPQGRGVFAGLVSEQVYVAGPRYRRCALSEQARAGVRILRQPLRWREIEWQRGKYTYTYLDEYVRALAEHGIEMLPILFDPPAWRSSRPQSGAKRGVYPPRKPREMGAFAARMVRRYGTRGSYWRANLSVPKVPIRYWQVWNEPNFPYYWPSGPNAAQYVKLQRAVARAIWRADPEAEVVTAGLPHSAAPGAIPLGKYITQMYKAGARGTFNMLAVNAYARDAKELIKRVKAARKIMKKNRDRARIWVTELGWATQGPSSRYTVSRERQAELIGRSFAAVGGQRRKLGISGLVYYNWQDAKPYAGFHDFWGLHTGLVEIDGDPKPGLGAYRSGAHVLRNAR